MTSILIKIIMCLHDWMTGRNLLIVVTPYLAFRLRDSLFSQTASSWMPFVYTLGNFLFLIRATLSQKKQGFARVQQSTHGSIAALAAVIFILLLSTQLAYVPPTMFFILMM